MKKTFVLFAIAAIAVASTFALIKYTRMESFAFAIALNFLLMLFVVIFTDVLKSPFNFSHFDERKWERKGVVYESLGVNLFRKLLIWTGWEKVIRKAHPVEKNTKALTNLYYQTKKSEVDHTFILLIVLGFNIFVAVKFGLIKSMSLLISNILLHVYPIILQRYNRPRIARAIKISERKATR